ncbi:hypothetical protein D6D12_08131 [Aureobasidium pullulans]|uniref:Uncharacterized protein n=1 Tax=Aureobasidium pullulans TaxID=5580 RepID=A0AB74JJL5_AURPU|nr:hypothetical protein D6D12_08131 [Aureobasidium pullulans]
MLPRSPCRWLWVTIVAFIELPDNVKEKSIHFQYLVSTLARLSSNLASQHDSSEGALTRKTSTALTENEEKTKEDLESEVKRAQNDDHTLGNPPVGSRSRNNTSIDAPNRTTQIEQIISLLSALDTIT